MTTIRDVMTNDPVVLPASAGMADAARMMRDRDIGDVLVSHDDGAVGLVTDRDLVVRGLAADKPDAKLGDVSTTRLVGVPVDAEVEDAVNVMRERAIRRVPVVDGNVVVGMVSIGDLAIESDRESALADISKAPPNH